MRYVSGEASLLAGEAKKTFFSCGIFVFPTETVYGLGANPQCPDAVDRVFEIKGRPREKPLTLHCSKLSAVSSYLGLEDSEIEVLRELLPNPLTVITSKGVGVRVFRHPFIEEFCRIAGIPIAATSANSSGFPSHSSAIGVYEDLGGLVPLFLDMGPPNLGMESTVLDMRGSPRILRMGACPVEKLREILGEKVQVLPPKPGTIKLAGKRGIFVPEGEEIPKQSFSVTIGFGRGDLDLGGQENLFYEIVWSLIRDPTVRNLIFLDPGEERLALRHRMIEMSSIIVGRP